MENLPITTFDLIAIFIFLLFVLISMMKGLVGEIVTLLRWVIGFVAAWIFADFVADFLLLKDSLSPEIAHISAFIIIFSAVFVVMFFLRKILTKCVTAIGLGGINRLLGGVIGAIKAVILLTIIIMLGSQTPLTKHPQWQASYSVVYLQILGNMAIPYLKGIQENTPNISLPENLPNHNISITNDNKDNKNNKIDNNINNDKSDLLSPSIPTKSLPENTNQ
ncbi:MAG: CvpA family protein [Neisseriaceae bacterium]|nr:CvpA family protein [Neisseriaceae bacterium]